MKLTEIQRSIWLAAAILASGNLFLFVRRVIFCNKFIPWGLNALVLGMKKDESLYHKHLLSWTYFACWCNTVQITSFNANFLLFLCILTLSSFPLENDCER